jgi:hypothetical protein
MHRNPLIFIKKIRNFLPKFKIGRSKAQTKITLCTLISCLHKKMLTVSIIKSLAKKML